MQRIQAFLIFALFLLLAVVKLLLPQQAAAMRQAFETLARKDEPYVRCVESAGERLAVRGLQDGLVSVFREAAFSEEEQTAPEAESADGKEGEEAFSDEAGAEG